MADLGRNQFPDYVKLTRLAQGRRQVELAQSIGVSATALCRYEQGEDQTLGDASIARLCDALSLARPAWLAPSREVEAAETGEGTEAGRAEVRLADYFCATPGCPRNHTYVVGKVFRYLPTAVQAPPDQDICCPHCGAMLSQVCFSCGASFRPNAANCSACTRPYVAAEAVTPDRMWAETWNREFQRTVIQTAGAEPATEPIDRKRIAAAQKAMEQARAGLGPDGGLNNGVSR